MAEVKVGPFDVLLYSTGDTCLPSNVHVAAMCTNNLCFMVCWFIYTSGQLQ